MKNKLYGERAAPRRHHRGALLNALVTTSAAPVGNSAPAS